MAALWALLFLALCVNRQELWVVLAGLVGYACLCLLLDVVAIPPFWEDNNGPLKASQAARLSNGLVCVAHSIAMGLAAGELNEFLVFFGGGIWGLSVRAWGLSGLASYPTHPPTPQKKQTHPTALGASRLLKLTMACGFLLFDLWDKAWKRLYTSPPYRYTRGVPYAMQVRFWLVYAHIFKEEEEK